MNLKRFSIAAMLMLVAGIPMAVRAADEVEPAWLAMAEPQADEPENEFVSDDKAEQLAGETGWTKPIPLTFGVDYTLVSDYIFRGINFSEYPGEGREKLNHQMTVSGELDMGEWGRLGGSIWFEWFAGQKNLNAPGDNHHLQEVDYTAYYGFDIPQIGVSPEIGFIYYAFPRGSGDFNSTQELYLNLGFDESVWLRAAGCDVKESILNPYLFMAFDLDLAAGGSYYELGMSHDFVLNDLGCGEVPFFKDVTLTPSWAMSWQNNWLNKIALQGGTRRSNFAGMQNMVWGLDLNYDLKSALKIPDKFCGEMYVKGFIYYSQALNNKYLNDEFWGGMSVGYSW